MGMRAGRAAFGFGLAWCVSWFALSAALAQAPGDIPPPDLPQPVVTVAPPGDSAMAAGTQTDPAIAQPDLPPVSVAVPQAAPSAADPAVADAARDTDPALLPPPDVPVAQVPPATATPDTAAIALPGLPDAPVTITMEDLVPAALASRLAGIAEDRSVRLSRKEREAMAAFYERTGHHPLWSANGTWTQAAKAVMQRLRQADEDGLDSADYPVPAVGAGARPEDWAEAEMKLSESAIRYARDARGGRIEPTRLSNLITPKLELPEADAVLSALAAAGHPDEVLEGYNPQHPGYAALKAHLAELRANHPSRPMVRVPRGPALRIGMRDSRVPLIRARFNLGPAVGDENAYDERVAMAVAEFQKSNGLRANGVLTQQTVVALSTHSSAHTEADLIANMERWRWLPTDMGERYVAVNVPEFKLRLVDDGQVVHEARVIVGKPETPTPIFSDEMERVIVNPTWTVPPSIIKNEFLPGLASDPYYAERRGFKVIRHGDRITIQQPPGERNALGFIKFIFPNQHSVYLHDTPSRKLFSAKRRAFSHGCVRVDQPFDLAQVIFGRGSPWSQSKLRAMIGKGERYIPLKKKLPVHLTYFTLSVDQKGELQSFSDLYGFNKKVKAALGLEG
jgi:murein L,D-transpeptidase YcbB/YkuD